MAPRGLEVGVCVQEQPRGLRAAPRDHMSRGLIQIHGLSVDNGQPLNSQEPPGARDSAGGLILTLGLGPATLLSSAKGADASAQP